MYISYISSFPEVSSCHTTTGLPEPFIANEGFRESPELLLIPPPEAEPPSSSQLEPFHCLRYISMLPEVLSPHTTTGLSKPFIATEGHSESPELLLIPPSEADIPNSIQLEPFHCLRYISESGIVFPAANARSFQATIGFP